jgi:hypothetical protein
MQETSNTIRGTASNTHEIFGPSIIIHYEDGIQRHVVSLKYADISEVHTASIISAILMMEAVRTSETSVYFNETTRRCVLEAVMFILAAVRT